MNFNSKEMHTCYPSCPKTWPHVLDYSFLNSAEYHNKYCKAFMEGKFLLCLLHTSMIKFVSQKFRDSAVTSQMLVSKSWIWEVSIANWLSSSQAFLFLLPTCHSPKIFIAHLFTEWVDFGTEFFIMSNISSAALFDSRKVQCDLSWISHTNSFVQHKIKNLTLAYSLQIFAFEAVQ